MPYRLVMRKLQTKQGSGAPTDLPTVLKIVEAPKRSAQRKLPERCGTGCTSFPDQRTKTGWKEAGTRKRLGSRRYSQRSSESYYSGEASTYSGPIQHVSGKKPFPESMETLEIGSHTEGQKQGFQSTIFLEAAMHARIQAQAV